MGIKGLWSVLSPYSENKPLSALKGEKIAIDLSGWICDAQNITEHYVQPKMYLRNLFFRTSYLLLNDITPLFVLDGDAPQDKLEIMQERNKRQFRGSQNNEAATKRKPKTDRKRFKGILKECCELLTSLGVQYVAAEGEAEQLCAALNEEGVVDGVVSSDSDCFAYGAVRVLRNLSPTAVDVYDINSINRNTGWGRYKCVCMAFLCGCDYNAGLTSANATAAAFLKDIADGDAIDRIKSWRADDAVYMKLMKDTKQKVACKPCDKCKQIRSSISKAKSELKFAEKARAMVEDFPPPYVLEEFLSKVKIDKHIETKWKRPDLIKFSRIMITKIGWTEKYCVEKMAPLMTGWQLRETQSHSDLLQPERIVKTRRIQGVPSVEVLWNDIRGLYKEFIPDDQFEDDASSEFIWTTVESIELFIKRYQAMYEEFLESKKKPKKGKPKVTIPKEPKPPKKRERKKKVMDGVDIEKAPDDNLDLNTSKKAARKRKIEKVTTMKNTKASKKATLQITLRTCINNKKDVMRSFTLMDSLLSNGSICNLSDIIDNIVTRKRAKTKYGNMNLIFDAGADVHSAVARHTHICNTSVQSSTPMKNVGRRLSRFFDPIHNEVADDFEISLNKMVNVSHQSSVESVNNGLPSIYLEQHVQNSGVVHSIQDSDESVVYGEETIDLNLEKVNPNDSYNDLSARISRMST